jgi:hypothetical protein
MIRAILILLAALLSKSAAAAQEKSLPSIGAKPDAQEQRCFYNGEYLSLGTIVNDGHGQGIPITCCRRDEAQAALWYERKGCAGVLTQPTAPASKDENRPLPNSN